MHLYPRLQIVFVMFALTCAFVLASARDVRAQNNESSRPVARLITDNPSYNRARRAGETSGGVPVAAPVAIAFGALMHSYFSGSTADNTSLIGMPDLGTAS